MTIKVNNAYIHGLVTTGDLEKLRGRTLPAKTSFFLTKVFQEIENTAKLLSDVHRQLAEKYGEKGEDGNLAIGEGGRIAFVDAAAGKAYSGEMEELLAAEVDLGIAPVPVDLDTLPELSMEEMAILMPLITTADADAGEPV